MNLNATSTAIENPTEKKDKYFYNLVCAYCVTNLNEKYFYVSIELNHRIEYGSDLEKIRQHIAEKTNFKSIVIVSWREMTGANRPAEQATEISIVS